MLIRRRAGLLAGALAVALALAGCGMPATPEEAVRGGKTPGVSAAGDVYLASLIGLDVNTDYGIPILVGPNVSTLTAGDLEFWVLNKWGGLAPGPYVDTARILAPDGTVLAEETTEFEWQGDQFSATTAKVFQLSSAEPGIYTVQVIMNGAEVLRYRFRVALPEE